MRNYISVNTKINFDFKVEINAIYDAINSFFNNQEAIILSSEPIVVINDNKSNLDIFIKYKLKKDAILSFETKKMIFMLQQALQSLINVKPNNINMVFEGFYDI
ncbi:MMB_0454 family protein [Metamycoplasma canadense]|uniref:Uncharacterized protein n=1 Tax=Metamycoplasma canadense TaxID=29554 RepID=A0A077L6Z6_9BACT|nr:hypothetical protein [Metamycoplasma canadense]BAP39576.1 hypothetical protein MCAN360_0429 [Metamycoplasma canadense]